MTYNKLICFDFDGTLVNTELEDSGRIIWKQKTGKEWPYYGWWSKPESLDMDIFETPINKVVYYEYLKAVSDSENFVFLATGRLERLRKEVEKVLNKYNLSFTTSDEIESKNGVFLNTGGDTFLFKKKLFEKMINKLQPDEFILYDDREEHLIKFIDWAKTMPCDVTIIDVVNMKKTKINNK